MSAMRAWRTRKQRYALSSERCPVCSVVQFPPREVCVECGAPQHLPIVAALPAMSMPIEAFQARVMMMAAPDSRMHN